PRERAVSRAPAQVTPSEPVELTDEQQAAVRHLLGFPKQVQSLGGFAGCLAADTVINVNRAGKGSRMTVEKLVKQFAGTPPVHTVVRSGSSYVSRVRPWDPDIPTYIARAEGGVIRRAQLKDAWFSGCKETFTVTTDTGRTVRATAIHPFLTEEG